MLGMPLAARGRCRTTMNRGWTLGKNKNKLITGSAYPETQISHIHQSSVFFRNLYHLLCCSQPSGSFSGSVSNSNIINNCVLYLGQLSAPSMSYVLFTGKILKMGCFNGVNSKLCAVFCYVLD